MRLIGVAALTVRPRGPPPLRASCVGQGICANRQNDPTESGEHGREFNEVELNGVIKAPVFPAPPPDVGCARSVSRLSARTIGTEGPACATLQRRTPSPGVQKK